MHILQIQSFMDWLWYFKSLPGSVTAVGMLIVQTMLNFLIPSGSGQTVVTMPIMAPLVDLVGVQDRQQF